MLSVDAEGWTLTEPEGFGSGRRKLVCHLSGHLEISIGDPV